MNNELDPRVVKLVRLATAVCNGALQGSIEVAEAHQECIDAGLDIRFTFEARVMGRNPRAVANPKVKPDRGQPKGYRVEQAVDWFEKLAQLPDPREDKK